MPRKVMDLSGERVGYAARLDVASSLEFWQWRLEELIEKLIADNKGRDLRITFKGKKRLLSKKLTPGSFKTIDAYRLLLDLQQAFGSGDVGLSTALALEFGELIHDVEQFEIFGKTAKGLQRPVPLQQARNHPIPAATPRASQRHNRTEKNA